MLHVRVTAPMGVTLRAPLKLKLSRKLLEHRRHAVRPLEGGLVEPGRHGVNFVSGDEFDIDGDVTGPTAALIQETSTGKTLAELAGEASEKASAAAASAKGKKAERLL